MSGERAKNVLATRAEQIMASAELAAQDTNDWQAVQAYMTRRLQNLELTEAQQEKLTRYQFAYNQLVTGKYTEQEVCDMLQSTYGLSYGQALRDVRDSKEVFASSVNINKLFEIKVQLELNRNWTQMAIAANDLRAAAQFDKNRAKLLSMLPEKEDSAADDFAPHTNVYSFDPAILGLDAINPAELQQLLRDIKAQYPGKLDVALGEFEDAIIVEEDGREAATL